MMKWSSSKSIEALRLPTLLCFALVLFGSLWFALLCFTVGKLDGKMIAMLVANPLFNWILCAINGIHKHVPIDGGVMSLNCFVYCLFNCVCYRIAEKNCLISLIFHSISFNFIDFSFNFIQFHWFSFNFIDLKKLFKMNKFAFFIIWFQI